MDNEAPYDEIVTHELVHWATEARLCSSAIARNKVDMILIREAHAELSALLNEIEHNRKVAA